LAVPFRSHGPAKRHRGSGLGNAGAGEQVTVTFRGQSRSVPRDGRKMDGAARCHRAGRAFDLVVADLGKNR